jgi:hypothetical protein
MLLTTDYTCMMVTILLYTLREWATANGVGQFCKHPSALSRVGTCPSLDVSEVNLLVSFVFKSVGECRSCGRSEVKFPPDGVMWPAKRVGIQCAAPRARTTNTDVSHHRLYVYDGYCLTVYLAKMRKRSIQKSKSAGPKAAPLRDRLVQFALNSGDD